MNLYIIYKYAMSCKPSGA